MSNFSLSQFDFSGKRVRFNGKVQSKFDLSYLIGLLMPCSPYAIYPVAYHYSEYADELLRLVSSNDYE